MSESKRSNAKDTKAADKKSTAAEKAPVIDLGFLEEDDDFDEFPAEDWKEKVENEDEQQVNIWEDNWDDDNIEDDFSKQLKAELEKRTLTANGTLNYNTNAQRN